MTSDGGTGGETLSALLQEDRRFPPSEAFAAQALVGREVYQRADEPGGVVGRAGQEPAMGTPWTQVLEWDVPFARWFVGGKLNASVNCVDRHVATGLGRPGGVPLGGGARGRDKDHHLCGPAGDGLPNGQRPRPRSACRLATASRSTSDGPGGCRGDAGLRAVGAPHSVVFGGFSAEALAGRILDLDAAGRDHRRWRVPPGGCVRG